MPPPNPPTTTRSGAAEKDKPVTKEYLQEELVRQFQEQTIVIELCLKRENFIVTPPILTTDKASPFNFLSM